MKQSTIVKIYLGLVALGLVVGILIPDAGQAMLNSYGAVALTLHVSSAFSSALLEDLDN